MAEFIYYPEIRGGSNGVIKYHNDHDKPVAKDEVVSELITDHISECAMYLKKSNGEACVSDEIGRDIGKTIGASGDTTMIMTSAKAKLNCDDERCVLTKLKNELGEMRVRAEIQNRLKIQGPTDNSLLSNVNIDSILRQWVNFYPVFYPYSFNMLNYASYSYNKGYIINKPDTLATILFPDLYYGENPARTMYRCCACVINSDTYQGEGKHWMALFADARGPKWTIEFFNSSGNAPAPEWVSWLIKTKNAMEMIVEREKLNVTIEIIKVSDIRHQQSRTECGLYSLFYIWARLNSIPPEYFLTKPIPDQLMFEFRQHLFTDPKRKPMSQFNWLEYKRQVPVEWE